MINRLVSQINVEPNNPPFDKHPQIPRDSYYQPLFNTNPLTLVKTDGIT